MSNKDAHQLDHLAALIIVAGLSGAGKSSALNFLADFDFFTLENLPVPLLRDFIEFSKSTPRRFSRTALLPDLDSSEKVADLLQNLKHFTGAKCRQEILFLDCKTEKIVHRYNETRRPHPQFDGTQDKSLEDAIQRERNILQPLKERSNLVLDTSTLNVHDLKREIKNFAETFSEQLTRTIRINFVSFGFKYGIPLDLDLLVDIRFLPNPYFIEELREKTGIETEVSQYVLNTPQAQEFIKRYSELLSFLLPRYVFEGKAYLNIGIGCTGGKHRSVVIAEELASKVRGAQYSVSVKHRDAIRQPELQRE